LSLRTLAERAGVSHGYLSRAENGHLVPVWGTLLRIAEALDCEPHLRLLPSRDTVAARARDLAAMTPPQRLAKYAPECLQALHALAGSGAEFVVAGSVAGLLQGLPMTIDSVRVFVRDDDTSCDRLLDLLMRAHVLFREIDHDELRRLCATRTWPIGWHDMKIELVEELPPATELPLGPITVPVVPLTSLVVEDRDAADVFDTMRDVLAED